MYYSHYKSIGLHDIVPFLIVGFICGLRYANSLNFLEQLLRLHFKNFRDFVAFANIVDKCGDQDNDLLSKTPR